MKGMTKTKYKNIITRDTADITVGSHKSIKKKSKPEKLNPWKLETLLIFYYRPSLSLLSYDEWESDFYSESDF